MTTTGTKAMEAASLEPCPLCGESLCLSDDKLFWLHHFNECALEGFMTASDDGLRIAAWNRRPVSPPAEGEVHEPDDIVEAECPLCDGDGIVDYYVSGVSDRDGSLLEHWRTCPQCHGSGTQWAASVPATEQEIMEHGYDPSTQPFDDPMRHALLTRLSQPSAEEARKIEGLQSDKDGAYLERNQVVAALAAIFPSGIARTDIPGWLPEWHGCVYIDLPTGQASWHYHDSQAHLFAHLPPYTKPWDGHTTEQKYERLAMLTVELKRALSNPQGGNSEGE